MSQQPLFEALAPDIEIEISECSDEMGNTEVTVDRGYYYKKFVARIYGFGGPVERQFWHSEQTICLVQELRENVIRWCEYEPIDDHEPIVTETKEQAIELAKKRLLESTQ